MLKKTKYFWRKRGPMILFFMMVISLFFSWRYLGLSILCFFMLTVPCSDPKINKTPKLWVMRQFLGVLFGIINLILHYILY